MKLLFTDIDGTLLTTQHTISEKLRLALISFMDNGGKLILCSGRPEPGVMHVKDYLRLPNKNLYISSYNGAKLYDCENDHVIFQAAIPKDMVRQILDAAYQNKLHSHTYNRTHILSEFRNKELDDYENHVSMVAQVVEDIPTALDMEPHKMLAISLDETKDLTPFIDKVNEISNHSLTLLMSNAHYLEIFSNTAGKGAAVERIVSYVGASMDDTIAVGDAPNDLTMIETAHLGVAMQNATDEVKNKADYITKNDNDHDGLLEIIEQFTKD